MRRSQFIELLSYTRHKEILRNMIKTNNYDFVEDILNIYRISTSNEKADNLVIQKINEMNNKEDKRLVYSYNIQSK